MKEKRRIVRIMRHLHNHSFVDNFRSIEKLSIVHVLRAFFNRARLVVMWTVGNFRKLSMMRSHQAKWFCLNELNLLLAVVVNNCEKLKIESTIKGMDSEKWDVRRETGDGRRETGNVRKRKNENVKKWRCHRITRILKLVSLFLV